MRHKYLFILLAASFLVACSSGKSSLDRGNYDMAVHQSVKRLQQRPGHEKATLVLQKAYPLAVERHLDNIKMYDAGNYPNKSDLKAREYQGIQTLNNVVKSYPDYRDVIELIDVTEQLANTREQAALEYITRGKQYLDLGTKESARMAYFEFEKAERYKPGDTEIMEYMMTSLEAGTVNIAFEFPANTGDLSMINTDEIFFEIRNDIAHLNYRFLRLVSLDNPDVEVDELVQLSFQDVFIGLVQIDRTQKYMVKDNVLIGHEKVNDTLTREIRGEVNATFKHYVKSINSSVELLMRRIDNRTGDLIMRRRFPSTFNWTAEWGTYNGDSRALTKEQLSLSELEEAPSPSRQWLFEQLCVPALNDINNALRNEYVYLR